MEGSPGGSYDASSWGFEDELAQFSGAAHGGSGTAGLGLIVRELADALAADAVALLVADQGLRRVEPVAVWGAAQDLDAQARSLVVDGFLARALALQHAAVEPLDPGDPAAAILGRPSVAVCAPVRPLGGQSAVMVAAVAPARWSEVSLWVIDRYAKLAELCLSELRTLEPLLGSGYVDRLTGCLTEAGFVRELRREVQRSSRHQLPLSCAFIGFDRSRAVREPRGHLHGSRLLANVAVALRAELRAEDAIGRYGRNEFVLLLPHTDEGAAMELAKRLRETAAAAATGPGSDPLEARIGVAQWQPEAPPDWLLAAAAGALLASQAAGGAAISAASAIDSEHRSEPPGGASATDARNAQAQISMADVLAVLAELDGFGGASMELVAWELDVDPQLVRAYWERARADRLITRFEPDPTLGEELWRLTSWGRRAARSPNSADE